MGQMVFTHCKGYGNTTAPFPHVSHINNISNKQTNKQEIFLKSGKNSDLNLNSILSELNIRSLHIFL